MTNGHQSFHPVAVGDDLLRVVDIGAKFLFTAHSHVLERQREDDLGVEVQFVFAAFAKVA